MKQWWKCNNLQSGSFRSTCFYDIWKFYSLIQCLIRIRKRGTVDNASNFTFEIDINYLFYFLHYFTSRIFCFPLRKKVEMERFWCSSERIRLTNYRSWLPSADTINFRGTAVISSVLGNFAACAMHGSSPY